MPNFSEDILSKETEAKFVHFGLIILTNFKKTSVLFFLGFVKFF